MGDLARWLLGNDYEGVVPIRMWYDIGICSGLVATELHLEVLPIFGRHRIYFCVCLRPIWIEGCIDVAGIAYRRGASQRALNAREGESDELLVKIDKGA